MKAQSIAPKNIILSITETLNLVKISNLLKTKTLRDLLLVTASLIFFSSTMYYAITSRKNVSAQATEYKIQYQKSQKHKL